MQKDFDTILNRTFVYAKTIAKQFYFEWATNPQQCPAFGGEIVHITREGWEHIMGLLRNSLNLSLRGVERRSNPLNKPQRDCFASLAMTKNTLRNSSIMDDTGQTKNDILEGLTVIKKGTIRQKMGQNKK